jgi:hypothetical protein
MITSTKIKRLEGKELVHIDSLCETAPATNKYLQRTLHYMMLVGTHVPDEYQIQSGALAVLLLRDQNVLEIEIWQTDAALWVANAFVNVGRKQRLRRGEGNTPLEAMIELITNIQRY